MSSIHDRTPSLSGSKTATFRADDVRKSQEFRKDYESKLNVVLAEDMPWEHSADGLIKHLVHHKMDTREMCVEAYMQFLKAGEKSGIHRHMWEEVIFVAEGSGYDLHWDLKWDCLEAFEWEWAAEPKAYSWKRGDYIYIPPFTNHQHVAGDHEECRLIVMSNRITKEMGFDWFDQVANAPGFDAHLARVHLVMDEVLDQPVGGMLPGHVLGQHHVGAALILLAKFLRLPSLVGAECGGLGAGERGSLVGEYGCHDRAP